MPAIPQQSPWDIQRAVLFAIFVRELGTRFGRFKLGYFWAILEPVAMIGVLCGVRVLFGKTDIEGIPFPLFFASGVLGFLLFQHIANGALGAVESNLSLFNYQRVKPVDTVLARSLLEFVIFLATGAVIFPAMLWFGVSFHWGNTLQFFATIGGLLLLSLGVGLALSILGPLWQESKKIVPVFLRLLFFLSGIFFSVDSLPDVWKPWALINPLLHVTELLRQSMFHEYTSEGGSLVYLWTWGLVCMFLGLSVYRVFRVKVVTSGNIR